MQAIIDIDYVKYAAANVGEKRTIKAIHQPTGIEFDCKTRTELWGRSKKRDGGILAEFNKTQGKQLRADEFVIIDVQTPEPLSNVLHTTKVMLDGAIRDSGATSYSAYLGVGESFRVGKSTILEYKGNRKGGLKPVHLDDVIEYLKRRYAPDVVEHEEADDAVVMEANGRKDKFVLGEDKDYMGCNVLMYNVNQRDKGVVDCSGIGSLEVTKQGVKGQGRLFFYHQILFGDSSDCYKSNSANPNYKFGEMSSYNLLKDCKTDKEALTALVQGYKEIYPTPITITGWRGDEFEVDWKYVLNENWTMAHMLRHKDDHVVGTEVLDKFGLLEG